MKPLFCSNCHRKLEIPKFLKQGNIKVESHINIECGYCKHKNKYKPEVKPEMKFKVGDLIYCDFPERRIVREITGYEGKFYLWKYTDLDEIFTSANSNDPDLDGWKLLKPEVKEELKTEEVSG